MSVLTPRLNLIKPEGTDNYTVNDANTNSDILDLAIWDIAVLTANYNSYATSKDVNGIFTQVDYKRPNATLYMRSVLTNPDVNGNYQTDTWTIYEDDGVTVDKTIVWTITYDVDGDITSKVVS